MNHLTSIATGLGGYGKTCEWCGFIHRMKCPLIKAVEYHPDGEVRRVEFYESQPHTQVASPFIPDAAVFVKQT